MGFLEYFQKFATILLACIHVLAGSVVVSVGAVVGMEEVVEGMGDGDGEVLAQLNPSGHVWHVRWVGGCSPSPIQS